MNEEKQMSRRTFLDWLLKGGLVAWVAGVVAPMVGFIWPAQSRGPSVQTVSAGKVDTFAEWQAKILAALYRRILGFTPSY